MLTTITILNIRPYMLWQSHLLLYNEHFLCNCKLFFFVIGYAFIIVVLGGVTGLKSELKCTTFG